MKQLVPRTRYVCLLLLALILLAGIVGPRTASANNAIPAGTDCAPCLEQPPQSMVPIAGPQITTVVADRDAANVVWVQIVVANVSSVDLRIPGAVTLVRVSNYSVFDLYTFTVSGLTPDAVYDFTVEVHGYLDSFATFPYSGSVLV